MSISTAPSKPWQRNDMNLYRAIKNCMNYWFARIILEQRNQEAQAFASRIHPMERRAIQVRNQRRRYWRYRHDGLSGSEASAKMWGITPAQYKRLQAIKNRQRAERYGGWPAAGTTAYNRMVAAW